MNKIVLQAKTKKEAEELLKRTVDLTKDETYSIKELKKPFKFLFFESKGKYEITIINKSEVKNEPKVKTENKVENKIENKVEKIKKDDKKETKSEFKSKEEIFKTNATEKEKLDMQDINLVEERINKFLNSLNLDINIVSIEKKSNLIFVNMEGKDVKYIIGEKGAALNSLEYLFNSIKGFRNIKIILDANGYREKREKSLINLAEKKAKKVIETKGHIKLYPMTSKERRVIHEELSKYKELETKSHGVEPKRYLVIKYVGISNE